MSWRYSSMVIILFCCSSCRSSKWHLITRRWFVEVIALLLILCRCFSERFSFLPMMMIPPINIPTRPPSTSSGRRSIPGQSLSLDVRKVLHLLFLLIAGQIVLPSFGQLFIWQAMQRTVTLDGDS